MVRLGTSFLTHLYSLLCILFSCIGLLQTTVLTKLSQRSKDEVRCPNSAYKPPKTIQNNTNRCKEKLEISFSPATKYVVSQSISGFREYAQCTARLQIPPLRRLAKKAPALQKLHLFTHNYRGWLCCPGVIFLAPSTQPE